MLCYRTRSRTGRDGEESISLRKASCLISSKNYGCPLETQAHYWSQSIRFRPKISTSETANLKMILFNNPRWSRVRLNQSYKFCCCLQSIAKQRRKLSGINCPLLALWALSQMFRSSVFGCCSSFSFGRFDNFWEGPVSGKGLYKLCWWSSCHRDNGYKAVVRWLDSNRSRKD